MNVPAVNLFRGKGRRGRERYARCGANPARHRAEVVRLVASTRRTQILSRSSLIDCSGTRVHAYRAHIKSLLTVINRPAAGPGIYLTLRTPRGSFLARARARTRTPGIRELVGI